jgi:ParB-like chromosome segregation protein Spo0J
MTELPLSPDKMPTSRIVTVDPLTVRPSPLNPRAKFQITEASIVGLAAEISAVGQINDAHGEFAADGTLEIFNGLRRAAACKLNGAKLRVRVHDEIDPAGALALAYRDDSEALAVSFWDLSASWAQMVADQVLPSEAALARAIGVDKSTMSRALAFRNAPAEVLAAFSDRREISQSQWMDLAPLLENGDSLTRIIERAALLVGKGYGAVRVAAEFKAAAANKETIDKVEVRNRHGKLVGAIQPNHRGGFTISVKPMIEAHPSYRLDYAKTIHETFVQVIKTWFEREA